MNIQLEPAQLKLVKTILKTHLSSQWHVLVFGSRATEKYKEHSDLDLCIMSQDSLPLSLMSSLREAFSESDLPIRVDIVEWSVLSESFRQQIRQNNIQIV